MLALANASLDRDAPISEQPLNVRVPSITSRPGLSTWLSWDDGQGGNPMPSCRLCESSGLAGGEASREPGRRLATVSI